MPFAILLLDSNYLTSAKYAPKKWNVNYISVTGLETSEQSKWTTEYGPEYTSVDSELSRELGVITRMLNTLESFGYCVVSSTVSTPTISYKDKENNRECYVWTLQKIASASDRNLIAEESHDSKSKTQINSKLNPTLDIELESKLGESAGGAQHHPRQEFSASSSLDSSLHLSSKEVEIKGTNVEMSYLTNDERPSTHLYKENDVHADNQIISHRSSQESNLKENEKGPSKVFQKLNNALTIDDSEI